MHFAAATNVGESVVNPAYHYDNNIGGTLSLLNAMVAAGVKKILFSSTCATYGLNPSSPMAEDAEQDPCSPYARTKLAVEWMIRDFAHTYDMGFTILRYFNAAGASTDGRFGEYHHPETHLIPLVLQDILDGPKALKVFGNDYPTEDGTCVRDYVHIEDLASAHLLAMEAIARILRRSTTLAPAMVSRCWILLKLANWFQGIRLKYTIVGRRPGDAPELVADPRKLQTRLGWKPRYPKIEDTVRTAWAWHKNSPDGYGKK